MPTYGSFLFGTGLYGATSPTPPASATWDVFDFCYPSEATMLTFLSFPGVSYTRTGPPYTWFDAANDYCMVSSDGIDSGFRFDYSVPNEKFSFQFSFKPVSLPDDFSDTTKNRFFAGVFNRSGYCVGLLFSKNKGIAISKDGTTVEEVLADSADILTEDSNYYVVRVVVNEETGRANIYVTRKDVLDETGVPVLRYTIDALETPGDPDNVRFEIVGSATKSTEIHLNCFRLSSEEVIGNHRPVAVITDDNLVLPEGRYVSLDGRNSYDPDTPPAPLSFSWTITSVPDNAPELLTGVGTTPSDPSGYTNVIEGSVGTFSNVSEGDYLLGDATNSVVMRVADDGSWIALAKDAVVAGVTDYYWRIISQAGWTGSQVNGTMEDVIDIVDDPSTLAPSSGDKYLVGSSPVGAWAGHAGEIAEWDGSSWLFTLPPVDYLVFVVSYRDSYRHAGSGVWSLSDPYIRELAHNDGRVSQIGVFLPATSGLYTVELVVDDGVRVSLPAIAVVNLTVLKTTLGLTPDLAFIWNYLSDFWSQVDGKEKAEAIWSGIAQVAADELMNLWQRDYSKSILDIQRTFQKRWRAYNPFLEEENWDTIPPTISGSVFEGGWASNPTPSSIPNDLAVDAEHVYQIDGTTSAEEGDYLVLEGIAYRIMRIEGSLIITKESLPTSSRPQYWKIGPHVESKFTNFYEEGVRYGDYAVFEVEQNGQAIDIRMYIYGVRDNVIVFEPVTNYESFAFKGVLRLNQVKVEDEVVDIPRLQQDIRLYDKDGNLVSENPVLEAGRDFRIE